MPTDEQKVVKRLPHMFFVEESVVLTTSRMLGRDELVAYLLICCGYNPRDRGSRMGAKAAGECLGMSKAQFRKARSRLEALGMVHVIEPKSRHSLTLISASARPFGTRWEMADGHQYGPLSNDCTLILLPMPLIYPDPALPEACLANVESLAGVRLLLHLYGRVKAGGYLPSNEVWWEGCEGSSGVILSAKSRDRPGLTVEEACCAGEELLTTELMRIDGDIDSKGRGVLRLQHVVPDSSEGRLVALPEPPLDASI
jgi:hypothetical protein